MLFIGFWVLAFLGRADLGGAVLGVTGLVLFVPGLFKRSLPRVCGGVLAVLIGGAYIFGTWFESEFPFSATLWLASQTRINGSNMADLVRVRSGDSYTDQHWHHCTWCDVVYPHAPHMAVQVSINANRRDFYLFDWDPKHLRLLPITTRTARVFPELIPNGYRVEPLGTGLNPQLYFHDQPCGLVLKSMEN